VPVQEVQLVGNGPLEGLADVDVEVADGIRADLGAAGRAPGRFLRGLTGATESRSAIWIRIGQGSLSACRPGLYAPSERAMRAATPLRQDGPAIAYMPGSASGVAMKPRLPGGATTGAVSGSRPRSEPTRSRTPSAASFAARSRPALRIPLSVSCKPSMAGTWEMTAPTRPSATAAATACPPEQEEPQRTSRSGSTPSRLLAKAIAEA
jgi:hypothetical protein